MEDLFRSTKVEKIYLCRHGATEWTESKRHTGRTDIALTKKGEHEARQLGSFLRGIDFDHVLCSPLKRVRATCHLAGFDDEQVILDDGLLEWDYGEYEGITSKEIHEKDPGWTVFNKDPPGGESSLQVQHRVDQMFERISKLSGTIALFGSGHISRVIGARWVMMPVSFGQHLLLSTASKSILSFEHGYRVINLWNDTSHIKS